MSPAVPPAHEGPPVERLGYRPALDGLRGVSVLGVMASHTVPFLTWVRPGQLGVDVFFVISGFLITTLLLEESEASGIRLGRFYLRRAARLLPALVTMLAVVVPAGVVLWPGELSQLLISAGSTLFYISNWVIIASHRSFWIMPHTWSLAVEEQFYLIWPPLLAAAVRRVPDRRVLIGGVAGLFLGFAMWRVHLLFSRASANHLLFGFDARADELLAGCLAAMARYWNLGPEALRRPSPAQGWGAAVAALAIASVVWAQHVPMETWGRPTFAVAVAVFILSALDAERAPGRLLTWRPLMQLGKISYGVYLWHLPLLMAVATLYPQSRWPVVVASTAATLVVALASHRFIERPALVWARRP